MDRFQQNKKAQDMVKDRFTKYNFLFLFNEVENLRPLYFSGVLKSESSEVLEFSESAEICVFVIFRNFEQKFFGQLKIFETLNFPVPKIKKKSKCHF